MSNYFHLNFTDIENQPIMKFNDIVKNGKVKINKRRNLKFQYIIEGVIFRKSGRHEIVIASSEQHVNDYPVLKAREEAVNNFMERAHFIYNNKVLDMGEKKFTKSSLSTEMHLHEQYLEST